MLVNSTPVINMEVEIPSPPALFLENGQYVAEATTPPYDGDQKTLGGSLAAQALPEPPSPPYQGNDENLARDLAVATTPVPPSRPYLEPESLALPSTPYQERGPVKSPTQWRSIPDDIVMAPYLYIKSLPGKGVRDMLIDALNIWLQVPQYQLGIIKKVVELLHTSSLMFDDIEDNSLLRRGRPTTHHIFGTGQTINSSTYILMSSVKKTLELGSPECVELVTEEVSNMLLGQSVDLHTTYLAKCPTEDEYISMVDHKTGALFRLAYRLMCLQSPCSSTVPDLEPLLILLGRYFQIRDDYMNLASSDYTDQKGFCEDLDEGKYSFPLIQFFNSAAGSRPFSPSLTSHVPVLELQNIIMTRNRSGAAQLSPSVKMYILQMLDSAGSLKYTLEVLARLDRDLGEELKYVEDMMGMRHVALRALVERLKVE
ncbi:terpenoid synthase [Decorospora gaudefroyi]|uniref:geranylgeranyl diphosphate synthase n=1 Tax=Decorospora gaudefroyi TaxID=184978 RepID=A0A6A5K6A8_9PLEO|nr:terpenoid synthase [Decorospora gaudefroyi]